MAIFSDAEIKEYETMLERVKNSNKRPQVSDVLMSLTFGSVIPVEDNSPWFTDTVVRSMYVATVKALMNDHEPDEFSPIEKSMMFLILQTAASYEAGMKIEEKMNRERRKHSDEESDEDEDNSWSPDAD